MIFKKLFLLTYILLVLAIVPLNIKILTYDVIFISFLRQTHLHSNNTSLICTFENVKKKRNKESFFECYEMIIYGQGVVKGREALYYNILNIIFKNDSL